MRRYQIQYHMVGGFSFYDRSEVKDLLSYLKLVQNPHDSIALQRVVNSPPRGIGKTTMETLERMALSSGMSTWDAMARAMEDRLLPQRTLNSLEGFRRLIDDARAMLGEGFAEKLAGDVREGIADDTSFDISEFAGESEESEVETAPEIAGENEEFDTSFNFAFDFGPSEEMSTIAAENSQGFGEDQDIDSASFNPFAPVVLKEDRGGKPTLGAKNRREDGAPDSRNGTVDPFSATLRFKGHLD